MKALVACRDCGRPVSTNARHCPDCGRVNPGGKGAERAALGIVAGTVILIVAAVGAFIAF